MNKVELNNLVNELLAGGDDILAEFYFVLKGEPVSVVFADMDENTQKELTLQFLVQLNIDTVSNEELSVLNLSSADRRDNALYEYDVEHMPSDFTMFNDIGMTTDTFNFRNNKLGDVKGILIKFAFNDNSIIFYKHNHSVSVVKKDSTINLMKLGNTERLSKLSSDILKISSSYDFMKVNDSILIKTMKVLESNFKFHDVIIASARNSVQVIRDSGLIENPDDINDMLDNVSFARKLLGVTRTSPVIGTVPNNQIISFVNTYPGLTGKFEFNENGDKIKLTIKKSKELLIKLLNDDYLQSQLTHHFYSSLAKDTIE